MEGRERGGEIGLHTTQLWWGGWKEKVKNEAEK